MKLTILPENYVLEVEEGTNLLKAINESGIHLAASCGGRGTCGRCAVDLVSGDIHAEHTAKSKHMEEGQVLSCQATLRGDAVIHIPDDGRRLSSHKVLINEVDLENPYPFDPIFQKIPITLSPPSLSEATDDLTRLLVELRKKTGIRDIRLDLGHMRKLPLVLREENWQVTVGLAQTGEHAEMVDLEPGCHAHVYGLAIDIGTTTIKMNLVDLKDGKVVASRGEYNRQQKYGDDVISRIVCTTEEENGLEKLQQAVVESINDLLKAMLKEQKIDPKDVVSAVVAGNTTMTHLFLGIPAQFIRLEPYIPAASAPQPVRAREIGLAMNPNGMVYNLPAVGSYVGGDITSGVLSTQLARRETLSILIDIGTNGEIVLGNQDWQMSCAASAGPCFEGGGIKFGMRAMDGAIESLEIDADYQVAAKTVNNKRPVGICGSGLIDAIAIMREKGIIDRTGTFNQSIETPRLRENPEEGYEFVLVWAPETAIGRDIVLQESDIKNVIRAKGAIFAGIRSLLNNVGMSLDDVEEFLIAGGFGNSLNIDDAITIGMLPDLPREKFRYVGNSSLKGAQMVLTSKAAFAEIMNFAKGMTYLELSAGNDFMDEFVSASFLPHTDLSLFPSQAS